MVSMGVPRQCWAFTVRPRALTEDHRARVLKLLASRRAFCVMEDKGSDATQHLHGGIIFDKPIIQGNVRNMFLRLFPDFDEDEKKHAIIIKHWYNDDWIDEYCKKNIDHLVDVYSEVPPGFEELFNSIGDDPIPYAAEDDKQDVRPSSPWYAKMEKLLLSDERFVAPYTEEKVLAFLNTLMNVDRVIDVIADPKLKQQKTRALLAYVMKDGSASYYNKRFRTEFQEDTHKFCRRCDEVMEDVRPVYKTPPPGYTSV